MKFSKRWRILPHLCLLSAGLVTGPSCVYGADTPAAAIQPPLTAPGALPPAPDSPAAARSVLDRLPSLREAAGIAFSERRALCMEKTFSSNCLREVDADEARYRRDAAMVEKSAKEVLRVEELRLKDERARQSSGQTRPALPDDVAPMRADDPDIPVRNAADDGQRASKAPKPVKTPDARPAEKSALTPEQQAQNRADFERRRQEAKLREAENAQRVRELQEKRQAYRARLEEQQEKVQKRLQRRAEEQAPKP